MQRSKATGVTVVLVMALVSLAVSRPSAASGPSLWPNTGLIRSDRLVAENSAWRRAARFLWEGTTNPARMPLPSFMPEHFPNGWTLTGNLRALQALMRAGGPIIALNGIDLSGPHMRANAGFGAEMMHHLGLAADDAATVTRTTPSVYAREVNLLLRNGYRVDPVLTAQLRALFASDHSFGELPPDAVVMRRELIQLGTDRLRPANPLNLNRLRRIGNARIPYTPGMMGLLMGVDLALHAAEAGIVPAAVGFGVGMAVGAGIALGTRMTVAALASLGLTRTASFTSRAIPVVGQLLLCADVAKLITNRLFGVSMSWGDVWDAYTGKLDRPTSIAAPPPPPDSNTYYD